MLMTFARKSDKGNKSEAFKDTNANTWYFLFAAYLKYDTMLGATKHIP